VLIALLLPFRLFEAKISCVGGFSIAQRAPVECAARARRLACITAGRYAQKSEVVRIIWCDSPRIGIALGGDFGTQVSSARICEWHESLYGASLVDLKQQESACAFDPVALRGLADVELAVGAEYTNSITTSLPCPFRPPPEAPNTPHNPPLPPTPLHPPPSLPKSPPTSPPTSTSTGTHLRT